MFLNTLTRERVAVEILDVFKEQTSKWGVTVERVEVGIPVPCYTYDTL